jgi:hypothetical protein
VAERSNGGGVPGQGSRAPARRRAEGIAHGGAKGLWPNRVFEGSRQM